MGDAAPFFVVGVPRSGTTLLRHMLRGHPCLAIPPESHFIPAALAASSGAQALEVILASESFYRWQVDPEAVRMRAGEVPGTPVAAVRAAFETYAAAEGKPRWGDKTPDYVRHLPLLAAAFPDALFVHIVRDGREVAASMQDAWWGLHDVVLAADLWRRTIHEARAAALPPRRYLEVHYARLVTDPEQELRRIIEFLGEDYVEGLLDYAERATAERPDLPREHRHLAEPLRTDVRDWRAGLSSRTQSRLNTMLAPTLRSLGLDPDVRPNLWRRLATEAHVGLRRAAGRWRRVRAPAQHARPQ